MGFWRNFKSASGQFATGMAQGSPGAVSTFVSSREDAERDREQRKQEIRNLYNSGPQAHEQALALARGLDPSFAAELEGSFTAQQGERLRSASGQLATTTAEQLAGANAMPIRTEQERSAATSEAARAAGNIAGAQSTVETLAGIIPVAATQTLPNGAKVQGFETKSPAMTGVSLNARQGLFDAEQGRSLLEQKVAALSNYDAERQAINAFAEPPELQASIERLKQSYVAAGGTPEEFNAVQRQLEKELLADREEHFKSVLSITTDPTYIRATARNLRVSPPMLMLGEGRAKALELAQKQNTPDNVRLLIAQGQQLLSQGDALVAGGETDAASFAYENAANLIEGYSPSYADIVRKTSGAMLRVKDNQTVNEIVNGWLRELAQPEGESGIRTAMKTVNVVPKRDDKISIEEMQKAAKALTLKQSIPNEGGEVLDPAKMKNISNLANTLNSKFSLASSPDSLDLRMLQAEEALAFEDAAKRDSLSKELAKSNWVYDPNENRFARERKVTGVLPAMQQTAQSLEPTATALGGVAAGMVTGALPRTILGTLAPKAAKIVADQLVGTNPLPGKSTFASAEDMNVIRAAAEKLGAGANEFKDMLTIFKRLQQTLKRSPTVEEFLSELPKPETP